MSSRPSKTRGKKKTSDSVERSLSGGLAKRYKLRLYVAGTNLNSFVAIQNVERLCRETLRGRAELEIVDLYQQPGLARQDRIVAAPCLVKRVPLPRRMFIGDMSNLDRLLIGLGLRLPRPAQSDGPKP